MKATVEKLEKNRVALHIEVEEPEMEKALDSAYKRVVQRVNVPGFRKGRAPRRILERQVGKGVLLEEALNQLVPDLYRRAVEETSIEPIDQPDVDIVQLEEGKPLILKAEVDVKPEVTLGDYKGISVERRISLVTDADVEEVLNRLRENNSELVDAEHDAVQQGDFVTIDFTGFLDGQPFPGGAAKGHQLEIGSGQFIPGFEDQLVGAIVDEERKIKVTFPEDYQNADLAGKETEFDVVIHGIKEKKLPELDDDFAQDVGEYDTLEDLRAKLRSDLEQRVAERADDQVRDQLIAEVVKRSEVEVPVAMIDSQVEQQVWEFAQRLAYQGIDPRTVMQSDSEELKSLRESMRPQAEQNVTSRLVLEAISNAEGIEITAEEIEAEIEKRAAGSDEHLASLRKQYADSEQHEALVKGMKVQKAVELLVESAQVTEKVVEGPEPSGDGQEETDVVGDAIDTEAETK